jgi:hypothetical protein
MPLDDPRGRCLYECAINRVSETFREPSSPNTSEQETCQLETHDEQCEGTSEHRLGALLLPRFEQVQNRTAKVLRRESTLTFSQLEW